MLFALETQPTVDTTATTARVINAHLRIPFLFITHLSFLQANCLAQRRRVSSPDRLRQYFLVPHLAQDLVPVVPEVRQGGVHLRHRQLGELRHDLIDGLALQLVPDVDVLNPNARTGDAGLAAADAGGRLMYAAGSGFGRGAVVVVGVLM